MKLLSLKNYFAYLTCFITGLVILVIELVSFRLLAPYFGTSSYVTGIIINTVLSALAIGYYIGGYTADNYKSIKLPYIIILLTAIFLLIFFYLYPIILKYMSHYNAILGSFLSIFIMFFIPMITLAFIPPYLIKMLTSVDNIGKTAGRIYSLSTFGSIIGGMLTTFIFIPYLGSQKTFITAVILLLIISILGLFIFSRYSILLFLIILIPLIFYPKKNNNAVYSTESQYNIIKVLKENNELFLYLNNFFGYHSKSLNNQKLSESYYDYFLITPALANGKEVLILGNGAGTCMTQLSYFYNLHIDGIEIDPVLTKVGSDILNLIPDKNEATIIHKDARYYLNKIDKLYDIIIIDLYAGSPYIPFHLTTIEFFKLVNKHLKSNGVIAINFPEYALNTDLETYYINTIDKAFPSIFISDHVIYIFKENKDLNFIKNKIEKFQSNHNLKLIFNNILNQINKKPTIKTNLIFTDDYTPIDNLIFKILKM